MQEATRHEALINLAFRDRQVTFVCPYDRTGLPGSVIADAASTHPAVIKGGEETASARYLGPPKVPPRCNRALPRPPARAEALDYRDDLRPVRSFVASKAKCAGLTSSRIPDLVLAISELAGNTLRHTDGGGTVQVWRITSAGTGSQLSSSGPGVVRAFWSASANRLRNGPTRCPSWAGCRNRLSWLTVYRTRRPVRVRVR